MDIYKKVQNNSLYEDIADQIESLIINEQLKKGDKLPTERQLCERFKVSRTTIRESITTLQNKGLVQVVQGRGTIVTNEILEKNVENINLILKMYKVNTSYLIEARETLELLIAGLAAERRTDRDITLLKKSLEEMENKVDNKKLFLENSINFHVYLAQATQNILFSIWIKPIATILMNQKEVKIERRKRAIINHKELYDSILNKDKSRAEKTMLNILTQYEIDTQNTHYYLESAENWRMGKTNMNDENEN